MSATPPPPGLSESDFERIEAAVLETERGRWFLTEYARRIRETETNSLLSALGRIEQTLSWSELGRAADAGHRFGAHVEAVRERLQDLAWRLRQAGADEACAALEAEAAFLGSFSAEAPRSIAPPREPDARKLPFAGQGAISLRLQSIGAMDEGALAAAVPPADLPSALLTPPLPDEDPRLAAFSALDGLSAQEKLALFA
jgi:hypothetical protein